MFFYDYFVPKLSYVIRHIRSLDAILILFNMSIMDFRSSLVLHLRETKEWQKKVVYRIPK